MGELLLLAASATAIGLLSSGHCIGMCGGLIGAFTTNAVNKNNNFAIYYNLGRITSYVTIGVILGIFSETLINGSSLFIQARYLSGLTLITIGLHLANWWHGIFILERLGKFLWKKIEPYSIIFLPITNKKQSFLLGLIWGWLPCGLVYSTLIWSAGQGNIIASGIIMFFFGVGTLPSLLVTGLFINKISSIIKKRAIRTTNGILIILFGLWTIVAPQALAIIHNH